MRTRFAALFCVLVLLPMLSIVLAGDSEEALWEAARQGDLATIKELVSAGTDINARTRYGATALAYACDKGHIDVVRFLVEKGANVNSEDEFYESTPLGWASSNAHIDIVVFLLENGATGADQVLSAGVRNKNKEMVAAALKGSDLSADVVAQALARAREVGELDEIVQLLESADVELPEPGEAIEVPVEKLESYAGKYKNDEIGLGLDVRVENGKLVMQATGQTALHLRALSVEKFEAIEAPQVKISFSGRGGMSEQATIEQGNRTFAFPRVTENEDAGIAAEPEAEPEPEAAASALPIERLPAQNWPSFRGPHASGIGDGQGAPMTWNVQSGENVRWKTPIPGLANSSPIIWGDRVFVTTAISAAKDDTFRTGLYGDVDSVEDLSEHTFKVYALDRKTGKIVWEQTAGTSVPGAKRHLKSTQANSTPVTDGKRVCALFGTIGLLACYDMNGRPLWTADLGVLDAGWFYDASYQWGHASSPVIYKDLVIVQADIYKDSFIAAWKLKTGKQAWRTPRDEVPTWGTPTIYIGDKRDELITNGTTVRGYDPASGKQLWSLGPNSEVTVATPIIGDNMFYVTAGYPPVRPIYAIKPGANGDLTLPEDSTSSDSIAWSHSRGGTYMPTPVVYDGQLYTCANNGRLTAYNAETGEQVYRQRIGAGTFTASPIAADGRLYFTSEEGDIVVVRAGEQYEELARNAMDEVCMTTPALSDGVLVVRTLKHVYGLGEPAEAIAEP